MDPWQLWNQAQAQGKNPLDVAQQAGYTRDEARQWIEAQKLSTPRKNPGLYTDANYKAYVNAYGLTADNPDRAFALAQHHGMDPLKVGAAMGVDANQAQQWIQSQGYDIPQTAAAQTSRQGRDSGRPRSAGQPPGPTQQPNPNSWAPGSGGGGGAGSNPYLPAQQYGFSANPYLSMMGGELGRQAGQFMGGQLAGIRQNAVASGGVGGARQGLAEGTAIANGMGAFAGQLANLYGGQFNADRNYGLQSDALDLNVYNTNQNWMRQGQQDQLGLADRMLGWNQNYGVGNATQAQNAPLNYWQQFGNQASQFAGLGGSQTQNMQGNPYLGALGGGMAAGQLWKSWGG